HADEDDLGGDERLADEDGGDGGDGDGHVGADLALEEPFQRAVQGPGAAKDGGQQGDTVAVDFARPGGQAEVAQRPPGGDHGPQVGADDDGEQGGQQVERQVVGALERLVGVGDFSVHEGHTRGKTQV